MARLEKTLSQDEIPLVYDMMRIAHKKMSKNLRNYFTSDDLFGLIMIEEEKSPKVTTTKEAAKVQRILMETKNRMLDQTAATTFQTTGAPMTPGVYQMFLWFGIFMIFVTFGILYQMVTIEIQKDTLLYAKFITTDQRN